jgi:ribosome production factor 1
MLLITNVSVIFQKCRIFGRELTRVIPNSVSLYRSRSGVKKMVKSAIDKGFTDIVIINEDRYQPSIL